jgi:hypothetical protein
MRRKLLESGRAESEAPSAGVDGGAVWGGGRVPSPIDQGLWERRELLQQGLGKSTLFIGLIHFRATCEFCGAPQHNVEVGRNVYGSVEKWTGKR